MIIRPSLKPDKFAQYFTIGQTYSMTRELYGDDTPARHLEPVEYICEKFTKRGVTFKHTGTGKRFNRRVTKCDIRGDEVRVYLYECGSERYFVGKAPDGDDVYTTDLLTAYISVKKENGELVNERVPRDYSPNERTIQLVIEKNATLRRYREERDKERVEILASM